MGQCCRQDVAFRDFLNGKHRWFFRAGDDTFVNPENLLSFVAQLERFVDTDVDIVMEAAANYQHDYPGFRGWRCRVSVLAGVRR
jgi:hypothetical protein